MKAFDWSNFDDFLADPIEYRFIDKANVDGNEAWGEKAVSGQDWYFKMHFPNNPVMPGVFVMEAIMQTGVLIVSSGQTLSDPLMMFNGCKNMRMFGEIRPGSLLKTHVVLKRYRMGIANFIGEACVDDKTVCSMEFTLVVPEELAKLAENIKKE